MALVVAVTAGAQGTTIHEYPWNPDWNNDNYVGSSDLTGFLAAYGSEFGNAPDPCDYDGTPLEELFTGISNGSIVLDSVFIEYELEDASTYFVLGCPDPVTDTLIFANSGVLDEFQSYSSSWQCSGTDSFGMAMNLSYSWNMVNGVYFISLTSSAISNLGFTSDGFFGSSSGTDVSSALPFPEGWFLDEGGIHIEEGYNLGDFINYANYIHILPYWHYAE